MEENNVKKLKTLYIIALSLIVLSWIITIVFLIILPDQIPMRLNSYMPDGIGRFGSKFECILFPIFSTGVGSLFLLMARLGKNKGDHGEEKAWILASIPAIVLISFIGFMIMAFGFTYK